MKSFLQQHARNILGTVQGFDRLRFRGTFRQLAYTDGMLSMLSFLRVLLKDFGEFAEQTTTKLRSGVQAVANQAGQPIRYLSSSSIDKERLVNEILRQQGVGSEGIIAVLSAVEVCQSFEIHRNRQRKILELKVVPRKCLHYYVYMQDPLLGRSQVRIQTWFPFNIHIVLNGREWLSRQMDQAGLAYQRRDNCFSWISDFVHAQKLLDKQLRIDWIKQLTRLLDRANPILRRLLMPWEMTPYWSSEQTEWATDVAFRSGKTLSRLFPGLVQHAMRTFDSQDVMRFLGRRFDQPPYINGHFKGEVVTDVAARPEGIRIKHRVKQNAIKMYDKQGSVLRVETTINNAKDLKAYRTKEGDPNGAKSYRPLRKSVVDLRRRAQLSGAANQRYLEGLATHHPTVPLKTLANPLCRPVIFNGRRYRALNPFGETDDQLLRAIARGDHLIKGFRNADIRQTLFGPDPDDPAELRRLASRTTRLLAILKAHRLIKKIPQTHRYQLTKNAKQKIPAILAARNASVEYLLNAA